jgi:hypothetical protein
MQQHLTQFSCVAAAAAAELYGSGDLEETAAIDMVIDAVSELREKLKVRTHSVNRHCLAWQAPRPAVVCVCVCGGTWHSPPWQFTGGGGCFDHA